MPVFQFQIARLKNGNVNKFWANSLQESKRLATQSPCDRWTISQYAGDKVAGSGLYKVPTWKQIESSDGE